MDTFYVVFIVIQIICILLYCRHIWVYNLWKYISSNDIDNSKYYWSYNKMMLHVWIWNVNRMKYDTPRGGIL